MQTVNANPNVKVTGRHLAITDAINEYATRKIEGLHLDYPKIIEAHVILGVEKYRHFGRQVLAQECVGELRIAQHQFEKCVVNADDLTGHGWMSVGVRL